MLRSVVIAMLLVTQVASAQTASVSDHGSTERKRAKDWKVPIVLVENAMVIAPPLYYYWRTVDDQKEDWELNWTWNDWKSKLFTTDELVLDTNRFEANAMRHPLAGALVYQIGRANGMGPIGSTIMDFLNSFVWEYFAEYREKPSVNDMFANTAAGFLIGEPLFQIGQQVNGNSSLFRRGLALVASPFHRAQKEVGLSPLADEPLSPNRFEVVAGSNAVRYGDSGEAKGEVRVGLDLEVMRDYEFGLAGEDAKWTGLATWNRAAFDLRFGGVANGGDLSGGRFRSSTTYAGRIEKSIGADGYGRTTFVGVGTGFEVMQRRLPTMLDRFAVFQLAEPKFGGWWRTPYGDIDVEVGASGDVAMVQSFARGNMPLMEDSSILLTRGYYYATGASVHGRVRARHGRWSAELESTAHQFWSFDEHSYGGDMDPKDLADGRVLTTAAIGMKPTASDFHVELYGNALLRRGTGTDLWRQSKELDAGLAVRAAF
jgi:hypothetical protein